MLPHVFNHRLAEFRALQQRRAVHQAFEIVRDRLRADRAAHALDYQVSRLAPAHVAQRGG